MSAEIQLHKQDFNEIEKRLLNRVMEVSKSMIESFRFRMMYDLKVTTEQKKKTLAHLQGFREKNWDKNVSRKEAYEKYVSLY